MYIGEWIFRQIHTLAVCRDDLQPRTSWKQQAHPVPESWFLNTTFQEKEAGLLGEMADSNPGQEIHKMNHQCLVVAESKEVLFEKRRWGKSMSKKHRTYLKGLRMAQVGTI